MKYVLKTDLSKITNIPEPLLDKLINKIRAIICDDVLEASLEKNNIIEIDVGIGTLTICIDDNNLRYRFTPSSIFNDNITATIVDLKSPVKEGTSITLASKVQEMYEELL